MPEWKYWKYIGAGRTLHHVEAEFFGFFYNFQQKICTDYRRSWKGSASLQWINQQEGLGDPGVTPVERGFGGSRVTN